METAISPVDADIEKPRKASRFHKHSKKKSKKKKDKKKGKKGKKTLEDVINEEENKDDNTISEPVPNENGSINRNLELSRQARKALKRETKAKRKYGKFILPFHRNRRGD